MDDISTFLIATGANKGQPKIFITYNNKQTAVEVTVMIVGVQTP